jgi:hypothetical protein
MAHQQCDHSLRVITQSNSAPFTKGSYRLRTVGIFTLTLPWIYQHYDAFEAYLSTRGVRAAFCLHLREGFIFASLSYQRLDCLSSDLSDSYTYHMSTVDLGTSHRRLRRGRKSGQQPEGATLPSTQTVVRFLQLPTITPFTRVYAYYGPFLLVIYGQRLHFGIHTELLGLLAA